jgi:hypothetical protein
MHTLDGESDTIILLMSCSHWRELASNIETLLERLYELSVEVLECLESYEHD